MLHTGIHLLTILAFAAHVVGGCCAHHDHGDECCGPAASTSNESVSDHRVSREDYPPCCRGHRHSSKQDALLAGDRPTDGGQTPDGPCQESSFCTAGTCQFLASQDAPTLDLLLPAPLSGFAVKPIFVRGVSFEIRFDSGAGGRVHAYAVSHCALLQTWQV